jgi:hypothetical protein
MKTFNIRSSLWLIVAVGLVLALIVQTDLDTKYFLITFVLLICLMFISFVNAKILNLLLFGVLFAFTMLMLNYSTYSFEIKSVEARLENYLNPVRVGLSPWDFDDRDEQIRHDLEINVHLVCFDLWISSIVAFLLIPLVWQAAKWGDKLIAAVRPRARS